MFASLMEDAKNTILETLNKKNKDFAPIILAACRLVPPQAGGNARKHCLCPDNITL